MSLETERDYEKRRLLLITPMLDQGGLERVCALTGQLLKPYFDVTIAVFDSRNIIYDISGLNLIDMNMPSKKGMIGKIWNIILRAGKLREIKRKSQIDIAYSFGPSANIPNVLSKQRQSKTWIGIRSYMDLADKVKLKFACKHADKIICCSTAIEDELCAAYGFTNTISVPNPFDLQQINARAVEEKPLIPWKTRVDYTIVSMGRENDVKGFWHLVKSIALLNRKKINVGLMIIGEGKFEEYQELANNLEIGDKIYFAGVQKNPYPYLIQGDVYALTSSFEGFPNALVEAMALGIPVVATDCLTGPKEILQDTYGIIIPSMNPEKNLDSTFFEDEEEILEKELEELLLNDTKYAHYSAMAKERASQFSYEKYVEALLGIS